MLMGEDETDKRVICNHKKTRKVSFCEKNNKIYRILLLMSHLLLTFANHMWQIHSQCMPVATTNKHQ